ncbi:MAG: serine/threonine protein kinase [Myxococcales bacterium]|nr:serine/threonine protein kinase [Myxococcales bacterium]
MDPETPRTFGRYQMIRRIGQGGMAEVYLAEVVGLGGFRKKVAIKRLLPHYAQNERFVTMLEDEARIAAAIRHPHVAEVLDFGSVGGQHFIAMEYIDGVDLATVLRGFRLRDSLLPLPAALYVARCVAEGLHAAHALRDAEGRPQEVIHRDVSPHNILLSYEGAVKLIDFGVAKAANNSTKTRSGVIKGKLQYMSPEQAQAQVLDARADIFSLGMTLYKMLTGRLPFTGQNEYQVYDQILRKKPIPPRRLMPEIPERVDAIVQKALRKNRARRFQTGAEMAELLDVALGEVDPDYGARELGELISAEMVAPSTPENLYEEDFIASESGVDGPEEGGDERDIDRLTDMRSVVKPTPGRRDPARTETNPTRLSPAHPTEPSPAQTEPTPAPTPVPAAVPASRASAPQMARPVAQAVPVAVPVPVRRADPPARRAMVEPFEDDGELEHTMAIGAVADDEDATLSIAGTTPEAVSPGARQAAVTPRSTGRVAPEEDATIADFDAEELPTTPTEVAAVEGRRIPWLWVGLGAALIAAVVGLAVALGGGEEAVDDDDEPPAVLKIGTGLPGEEPPPPAPDGGG